MGAQLKYYRRYIGDYRRDTSRLDVAQHGAYAILLDEQYATEKPIPADLDELYLICRAIKPEQQAAVRAVVDRYFPEVKGGRANPRASKEIETAASAIEKMREAGRKGAGERWGTLRKTDGAPYKNPNGVKYGVPIDPPPSTLQPPDPTSNHPPPTPKNGVGGGGARARPPPAGKRARRWGDEETVPAPWREWAIDVEGMTTEGVRREAAKFADHWRAKSGRDGAKQNWEATWRNWVRRSAEMGPRA